MGRVLVKIIGLKHIKVKNRLGLKNTLALTFHKDRKRNRVIITIKRRIINLENGQPLFFENGQPLLME